MSNKDLITDILNALDSELQRLQPDWDSKVEQGDRLWAGGLLLTLDVSRTFSDYGDPGGGSSKRDQLRMTILRDPRDPFLPSFGLNRPADIVSVRIWFRPANCDTADWQEFQPQMVGSDEDIKRLATEQLIAEVKEVFIRAVRGEEANRGDVVDCYCPNTGDY